MDTVVIFNFKRIQLRYLKNGKLEIVIIDSVGHIAAMMAIVTAPPLLLSGLLIRPYFYPSYD